MCPNGATNADCTQYMTDCKDYKYYDGTTEGLLHIKPSAWTGPPFLVRCYKGETLIHMRDDVPSCHSLSFNRSWSEYRQGFGDIQNGCFWLGNDKISALTRSRPYAMILDTIISSQMKWIIIYYDFVMNIAANKYRLNYTNTWGNGFYNCDSFGGSSSITDVKGHQFYTYDQDVNGCAAADGGGWWYNTGCSYGNLNGIWPKWPLYGTVYALDVSLVYIQRTT
ncbi:fibrinogen beta chain-like [Gigantopelta aegis]|uniref:fibrinogen beta chain-like n=1 Tax=Gigantopelta aegis TaxID=1735272 RepID=UPI001B88BDB3|nr:fibrinogen beta chain-like [Gigantopelta aegis]